MEVFLTEVEGVIETVNWPELFVGFAIGMIVSFTFIVILARLWHQEEPPPKLNKNGFII